MGRNKKLSDGNSSNGTSSGISVGQLLVTLKKFPTSLSTTPDIERHFMSAIKRRNDFELRKKSALEEIEKERKRLTQDTGSSISTSKVVMKPLIEHPVNFTNKSVHMETKSNIQPSTNNDFSNGYIDLNSLFGGEVTIKSEIVPSVAVLTRSNIPTKATTSSSNSSIISSKSKVSGGIIEDKPLPISELPKKQAPIEPASVNNVSELTTTVVPVPQQPKKKKLKITFVDE